MTKTDTRASRPMLGGTAAALMLIGAHAGQAADKVTFHTSWYAQAEHGGFYQAKAAGLYEKAGLDVTIKMGGPQVNIMQLLLAGEGDLIMGYDFQVLSGVEKGLPVVAVATSFQHDLRCLMARPDVKSLADLKGKTILIASGGRTTYWPWLKAKYGYTDEQSRPYTFNLQPFFADPNIVQQCYVSSEPLQAKQQGVAVNVFLLAEQGYPPYGSPIVTTRQYLDKSRDVVRRFVAATMEGWRDYLNNPTPGNALIKRDNPNMTDEQITFGIESFKKFDLIGGGDAKTRGIGTMTEERWRKTYEFMVEAGLLKRETDWRKAFTTEIVDGVNVPIN
jgi:NitT/TauT family transport system substrate-binding protein